MRISELHTSIRALRSKLEHLSGLIISASARPLLIQTPNADARILNYALNLARTGREENIRVALFSNDNLLRLNAHSEGILSLSVKDVAHDPVRLLAALGPGLAPVHARPQTGLQQTGLTGDGVLSSTNPNIHVS